ncbi:MAG: TM2 domain-containing protein [Defluviitaleaceae bacterium]|nr:TM2 domain-containing protein [Defluviitaleaceae bacterium]
MEEKRFNKITFALITWFAGCFGVDRFMRGQTTNGIIKLVTCGGMGVWSIIDLVTLIMKWNKYEGEEFVFDAEGNWTID